MKTKLFCLLALLPLLCNSQEKIDSYALEYFSEEYEIMASEPDSKGKYTFYVTVPPVESTTKIAAILVQSNELEEFRDNILEAKSVYEDWTEKAIENNVDEVDKEIELKKFRHTVAWTYGDWHFNFNAGLQARFKILDNKHLLIIENKNKLTASDNQFIDSKGFVLVFSNPEEVDYFISKINESAVNEFFGAKNQTEDIFTQKNN